MEDPPANPSPAAFPHKMRLRLLLPSILLSLGSALSACAPLLRTPTLTPAPPTSTATPTIGFPTLPPTPTLTPPPSPTPTPDLRPLLGTPAFQDDFSTDQGWDLSSDLLGASSLEEGRLVLALSQNSTFRYVLVPHLNLRDLYLQVVVRSELCAPNDEFGVLIRFGPEGENYRIGLHCDGRARITRVLLDSSIALLPPTASPLIIPGAPAENLLGVLAEGDRLHLYINGFEAFAVRDRALPSGRVALFARSSRSAQLTVAFDNLEISPLLPTPTPASPPATTP